MVQGPGVTGSDGKLWGEPVCSCRMSPKARRASEVSDRQECSATSSSAEVLESPALLKLNFMPYLVNPLRVKSLMSLLSSVS